MGESALLTKQLMPPAHSQHNSVHIFEEYDWHKQWVLYSRCLVAEPVLLQGISL